VKRQALVIDDDGDIRELLTVLLESAGFEVESLADGIHAVELKRKYDVIILDLNMPVFDGEQLTDYWQLTDPDILRRVIVLSGFSKYSRGRKLPTFAAIPKPFEYRQLLDLVEQCAGATAIAMEER